jgi:ribosomal protein L37E
MTAFCQCDPATKRCTVCGVDDFFCGSARACPAPVSVINEPPPVEQMPTREAPGFLEKVKNFATAAAGHVAAGMPMASDAEIIRRHDICLGCEHLQDNACTQCGCPVARVRGYVSKLSWADSECPVGKWGKAPSA